MQLRTFLGCKLEIGGIVIGCFGVAFHLLIVFIHSYLPIVHGEKNESLYFVLPYSAVLITLSCQCVKATNAREPAPLRFTKGWLIIYAMLFFEVMRNSIVDGSIETASIGMFFTILFSYFFIVIDSLAEKFYKEKVNDGSNGEPV